MIADYAHLADLADARPMMLRDVEIVDALVERFDVPHGAVIDRLASMDFSTVRREVMP